MLMPCECRWHCLGWLFTNIQNILRCLTSQPPRKIWGRQSLNFRFCPASEMTQSQLSVQNPTMIGGSVDVRKKTRNQTIDFLSDAVKRVYVWINDYDMLHMICSMSYAASLLQSKFLYKLDMDSSRTHGSLIPQS